ncbi:MAG: Do family serine endopeptidase [Planctomycetaceae bacterium]
MKPFPWRSAGLIAIAASAALFLHSAGGQRSVNAQSALSVPSDTTPSTAAMARAFELSEAFRDVSRKALPAVVSIKTTGRVVRQSVARGRGRSPFDGDPLLREFFGNDPRLRGFFERDGDGAEREFRTPGGQGSGFIIGADGVILTNAHVVADAAEVVVTLSDGREFRAQDIRKDPQADVAVLKIDAGSKLPTLPLGDDNQMEIGDWVLAFGSPFGLHHSVTQGIISAKGRGLDGEGKEFLQTDAAINPGNSGGPLVNLRGEVVGINTAISTRSGGYDGVSLAVPVNLVKWVANQLQTSGRVRRAFVGIQMQTIDAQLAKDLSLSVPQGVVVTDVVADSPADRAGFQPRDVILAVDGQQILNPLNMRGIVEKLNVGQTYQIRVLRDGREQNLKITVDEWPEDDVQLMARDTDGNDSSEQESRDAVVEDLGISVQNISNDLGEQLGISAGQGVVISDVQRNSPAEQYGLEPGMVIASVGNRAVTTVGDLQEAVKESREKGRLLLLVKKSEGNSSFSRFISVPLGSGR